MLIVQCYSAATAISIFLLSAIKIVYQFTSTFHILEFNLSHKERIPPARSEQVKCTG